MSDTLPPMDAPSRESRDGLATRWNDLGRSYFRRMSSLVERSVRGERDADPDLLDPRSEEMGDCVLREILELRSQGGCQDEIRSTFDPAVSPFRTQIKRAGRPLGCVTLLGPDELLVRRGRAGEKDAVMLHLRNGDARILEGVLGACRSRSREYLVLACTSGLELRNARDSLDAPPIATLAWPTATVFRPNGLAAEVEWVADDVLAGRFAIDRLEVSDDGLRVVVTCYRQGVLLASLHEGETPWTLLWPDVRPAYTLPEDAENTTVGEMLHAAISRDGRRVAFGCQDAGHFIAELDGDGTPEWYADVGPWSEYPCDNRFSGDGRFLALSSCHLYWGATVCFAVEGNRGVSLDLDEEQSSVTRIDDGLRVHTSCWLDGPFGGANPQIEIAPETTGFFLLAGDNEFRVVSPTGSVALVQGLGASACSVDYCPESRRIAIGSSSGIVHVYASDEEELEGRIDGFQSRRELYRWLTWEDLPGGPLRW